MSLQENSQTGNLTSDQSYIFLGKPHPHGADTLHGLTYRGKWHATSMLQATHTWVILVLTLSLLILSVGCSEDNPPAAPAVIAATITPTEAIPTEPPSTPTKEVRTIKQYSSAPPMEIDVSKSYSATFDTTEGEVEFELFADDAPNTVNNFVFLAKDGFYEGVIFHRVISGFMVQSGDPTGTGAGGPGYSFSDETVTRDYLRGTLAMANAGPNTNGSQFFIMHQDNALPKNYTIFGIVRTGIDVVDALAGIDVGVSPNGEMSKPVSPPIINSITITEN